MIYKNLTEIMTCMHKIIIVLVEKKTIQPNINVAV